MSDTYYLFLDESGDHSLDKIDPQYPVFVLGGVLVRKSAYDVIDQKFKQLKTALFKHDQLVIHTADMTRNKNGFENMKQPVFREKVYSGINTFMETEDYRILACAIKKQAHFSRYGLSALDPYHLALRILVERAFFAAGRAGKLYIIAECRGPSLDRTLEIAFLDLKVGGTEYIQASELNNIGVELHLRSKSKNVTGLQMADLVVSPIGRYLLGKEMYRDWDIIKSKFYTYRDTWLGSGLVVLPK